MHPTWKLEVPYLLTTLYGKMYCEAFRVLKMKATGFIEQNNNENCEN